jgi:hypothetical protein
MSRRSRGAGADAESASHLTATWHLPLCGEQHAHGAPPSGREEKVSGSLGLVEQAVHMGVVDVDGERLGGVQCLGVGVPGTASKEIPR